MGKPETLMIDDVKYVREDALQTVKCNTDGLERSIIRTYSAGVFIGYVKDRKAELNGVNIKLLNARRLWSWSGACSLSQLAVDGTQNPSGCKFSVVVPEQEINNVIEIIPVTKKASNSIDEVQEWKI